VKKVSPKKAAVKKAPWYAVLTRPKHRRPIEEHTPAQAAKIRTRLSKIPIREGPKKVDDHIYTGVPGFDDLFEQGIPRGSSILVAGGAGSGKTIFCLQTIAYGCAHGEKCIYMSFEESEDRLKQHMRNFGWDPEPWIKKGLFVIKRLNAFDVARSVEALLAKAQGELLIDFEGIPGLLPRGFKPDRVALDSLSAIAAAFAGKEETYRAYISQLFRLLEKLGATSFLISETEQVPSIYSEKGVEEFLADGVFVLYNLRKDNVRVNAIEVLKLRGAKHEKRVVPFNIIDGKGMVAYPHEEIFTEISGGT
jgi:circadian clock protein KaiC